MGTVLCLICMPEAHGLRVYQGSQKLFGFGQADICGNEDDPTLVFEVHSACIACSGVWGHAPPGKFLKSDALRLHLGVFLKQNCITVMHAFLFLVNCNKVP